MKVNKTSKSSRPTIHTRSGTNTKYQRSVVEKLDKSKSAQLKSNDSDTNRLLSIDIVYDKLQGMKEEYRQFYSEEQHFEGAWHTLLEDTDHFLEHLIEIFQAHNHVVEALLEFDKTFETKHCKTLVSFITKYEEKLADLSVFIEPDGRFRVRHRKLKEKYRQDPAAFNFLTQGDGFLPKLFDYYHSLKAIKPPTTIDEDQLAWYQGLFMDQKA